MEPTDPTLPEPPQPDPAGPASPAASSLRSRWKERLAKALEHQPAGNKPKPSEGFRAKWRENLKYNSPPVSAEPPGESELPPELPHRAPELPHRAPELPGRGAEFVYGPPDPGPRSPEPPDLPPSPLGPTVPAAPSPTFRARWRENLKYNVPLGTTGAVDGVEVSPGKPQFKARWRENLKYNQPPGPGQGSVADPAFALPPTPNPEDFQEHGFQTPLPLPPVPDAGPLHASPGAPQPYPVPPPASVDPTSPEKPLRRRWQENLKYNISRPKPEPVLPLPPPQESPTADLPPEPRPAPLQPELAASPQPGRLKSRWRDNLRFNRPQEIQRPQAYLPLPDAPEKLEEESVEDTAAASLQTMLGAEPERLQLPAGGSIGVGDSESGGSSDPNFQVSPDLPESPEQTDPESPLPSPLAEDTPDAVFAEHPPTAGPAPFPSPDSAPRSSGLGLAVPVVTSSSGHAPVSNEFPFSAEGMAHLVGLARSATELFRQREQSAAVHEAPLRPSPEIEAATSTVNPPAVPEPSPNPPGTAPATPDAGTPPAGGSPNLTLGSPATITDTAVGWAPTSANLPAIPDASPEISESASAPPSATRSNPPDASAATLPGTAVGMAETSPNLPAIPDASPATLPDTAIPPRPAAHLPSNRPPSWNATPRPLPEWAAPTPKPPDLTKTQDLPALDPLTKTQDMTPQLRGLRTGPRPVPKPKKKLKTPRIPPDALAVFTRQLAVMIGAGVPIHQALSFYAESSEERGLPQVIDDIAQRVSSGYRFSQALRAHPTVFSEVYSGLVETGETSSMLEEILTKLADLEEKQTRLRKKVVSTLAYPAMLTLVSLGSIGVFIFYVLPMMVPLFQSMHMALPWPTRMLLALRLYLPPVALAVAALAALATTARKRINSPRLRHFWHASLLKVPGVGKVVMKIVISRVLYSLATMLEAGILVTHAMQRSAAVSGNMVVASRLLAAKDELIDGKSMFEALSIHEVFPRGCVQIMCLGEETSNLADTVRYAANFYEEDIDQTLTSFAAMIEPMIMAFMGLFVGFIVLSAVMPTVQLLNNL